ncbi:hypothetical protein FOZ63_031237, partial [Perkinsus olseni]
STSFVRELNNEECVPLRPWSFGDRKRSVYGTAWDSLIEIDVENDIGRYRTIRSKDVQDAEATILNRRSPYSGWKAGIFMMHTSGPVVGVGPAPESDATSSLTIPVMSS